MVGPWKCAAIDHGVTIYQNGSIAPCCMIDYSYQKKLSEYRPDIFSDLKTSEPPSVCWRCTQAEEKGLQSYRHGRNSMAFGCADSGIEFLDIRNTNLCNLKCRTCDPINSHLIAKETNNNLAIIHHDISQDIDKFLTSSLQELYYTGGEPFINPEHWDILQRLIDRDLAKNVDLKYNTNLTTLKYKSLDIIDIWKKFRQVHIGISLDAVGPKLSHIRSGADWHIIEKNLQCLKHWMHTHKNIQSRITCTISLLNLWFLPELVTYAGDNDWPIEFHRLHQHDFLSLEACPTQYQDLAMSIIETVGKLDEHAAMAAYMASAVTNNSKHHLFDSAVAEIKRLDKIRGENLWSILPFSHTVDNAKEIDVTQCQEDKQ